MTTIIFFIIITLLGLVVGSFLSAVTYRLPRGINIIKGRSFCDNCKRKISWRDNVPVFSFYFLGGKCRNCKSQISIRYPLIEFFTMLVFLFVAISFNSCTLQGGSLQGEAICQWQASLGFWALPYLLLVAAGFVVVFVTDF
jgi:prepilin signal peptidase PulO-like enzyme (type II secretory pathway)